MSKKRLNAFPMLKMPVERFEPQRIEPQPETPIMSIPIRRAVLPSFPVASRMPVAAEPVSEQQTFIASPPIIGANTGRIANEGTTVRSAEAEPALQPAPLVSASPATQPAESTTEAPPSVQEPVQVEMAPLPVIKVEANPSKHATMYLIIGGASLLVLGWLFTTKD